MIASALCSQRDGEGRLISRNMQPEGGIGGGGYLES